MTDFDEDSWRAYQLAHEDELSLDPLHWSNQPSWTDAEIARDSDARNDYDDR